MRNLVGSLLSLFASTIPTTNTNKSPSSMMDLSSRFRQVYNDLEQPGRIHRNVSSTFTFSFVSPPHVDGTSTWRMNTHGANFTDTAHHHNHHHHDSTDASIKKKPTALYLPGLDGYGISAQQHQFDDLASTFDLWRLHVSPSDRSPFSAHVQAVVDFIMSMHNSDNDSPVTLIGESCGGLIAAAVAIKLRKTDILKGLVLVNPATSFDQTAWANLVPLLTSLPSASPAAADEGNGPQTQQHQQLSPYGVLGSLILASIVPDNDQFRRIVDTVLKATTQQSTTAARLPDSASSSTTASFLQKLSEAMADSFRGTEERLPPALLEHRVTQWLLVGGEVVNARLGEIKVPTLIVAGDSDRLLPSKREAERLARTIEHAETLVVRDRGHFVLDENVNLTEAILYSRIDPLHWKATKKPYDPISDWRLPGDLAKYVKESVQPFRDAFSPVYFSTDASGKRWKGMSKIPTNNNNYDKPILIVANHQFIALDLRILLADMHEERGIFPRGLAHPVTFAASRTFNFELGGRTPGILTSDDRNPLNGDLEKFGAVMVTPRNYYRLLQSGQDALLFPGGAAEAFSGNKSYPLFWPEKVDFVRTAARFNATIVPLSAVGMLDSFVVVAEPKDTMKLPFVGDRMRRLSMNMTAARYDKKPEDEVFGFPVALPAVPARNYFLFGKPIDTSNIDPNDKDACERIYKQAQQEVRRGLDDLLQAREHDPFQNTPSRLIYERVFRKKAPTFPVSELNQ